MNLDVMGGMNWPGKCFIFWNCCFNVLLLLQCHQTCLNLHLAGVVIHWIWVDGVVFLQSSRTLNSTPCPAPPSKNYINNDPEDLFSQSCPNFRLKSKQRSASQKTWIWGFAILSWWSFALELEITKSKAKMKRLGVSHDEQPKIRRNFCKWLLPPMPPCPQSIIWPHLERGVWGKPGTGGVGAGG